MRAVNRTVRSALLVIVGALALAACSGVPTSSAPQTVKALGFGGLPTDAAGPPKDAPPRDIVQGFLSTNWAEPTALAQARRFLTPAARKAWEPTVKATVIESNPTIGKFTSKGTVTVLGVALGTLNADGAYTPSFGETVKFTFTLDKSVAGQYLITTPVADGLVVTEDVFNRNYSARPIYFYDAADHYLVPYVRYSALRDQNQLANWVLNELANPPEPQNAVSAQTLPPQAHRITVSLGTLTRVQVAGSRRLAGAARDQLAAQVSQTLASITQGSLAIFDGSAPISVPAAHGTVFSSTNFIGALGPPPPPVPTVYYVANGRIVDQDGKPLVGPVNDGRYTYTSVALTHRRAGGALGVAAVTGSGARKQLLVGTTASGLRPTSIRGDLSRPTWAPGLDEVWIGAGTQVFRVTTSGPAPVVRQVATPSAAGGGRVVAVRLSPDGSRIAIVVSGSHRSGQLYIGAVVRGAGEPQVVNLQPISPDGVVITDVAWNYALRLSAIGYLAASSGPRVFETGVDGARWDERGISGLPGAPTSLTATTDHSAWVSADGLVWTQTTTSWISPGPTGQTPGVNPMYLT